VGLSGCGGGDGGCPKDATLADFIEMQLNLTLAAGTCAGEAAGDQDKTVACTCGLQNDLFN